MIIYELIEEWNGEPVTIYAPSYINDEVKIGRNTKIGAFSDICADVEIGKGCNIQTHVSISTGTKIGNGCFIAPGVRFLNDKYMSGSLQPPRIGNYVRIGGGCIILPDVTIGDNVFIGAGIKVTKSLPDGSVIFK